MSFIIGQDKTSMKATGRPVTVPDSDVNKLSYYLRCGTVSCGIDIIVDELVDFQQVHRLPCHRQDAIFKLAYSDFDLETLANKTIFLDDENRILPRGTSNEFYELERVQSCMAVQGSVLIGGQQKQVHKIMICNTAWITKFYVDPLKRNAARLRRIMGTQTQPSLTAETLAAAVCQLLLEDGTSSKHCDHCKGLDAKCACEKGCPAKAESQCKVVHQTTRCDSCKATGIQGARYKCQECWDYDLCQRCYDRADHASGTHAFHRIARVGSSPVAIQPQKVRPLPSQTPASPPAVVRSIPRPVPVTPEAKAVPLSTAGTEVASVPLAQAIARPAAVHREGQTVRLAGLVQNAERNGRSVTVVKDLGDCVIVAFPEDGKKIKVRVDNVEPLSDDCGIPVGSVVEIHGVSMDETLNGAWGVVIDAAAPTGPGRVSVRLLENESRTLSLKPENIRVVEDET